MNLVLFTDNLGSGGSQRQLCMLASEFQKLGHVVTLLTYNSELGEDGEFFKSWLDSRGIAHKKLRSVRRSQRPLEVRRSLAQLGPDSVLAFQAAPSLYAELAGLIGRSWGLVVSERTADPGSFRGLRSVIRLGHHVADHVTSNSASNRVLIQSSIGCRRLEVHVIYNAVDLQHFTPDAAGFAPESFRAQPLRLVILASHQWHKNLRNVLEAILRLRGKMAVHLRWYGGTRLDKVPLKEGEEFIRVNSLESEVVLLPPTTDPRKAYWESDAVMLASWFEGCPNVICEAMACGKPVLASRVSDNPLIIEEGVSGLLFDPHSPGDIAASISQFATLSQKRREAMGAEGRRRAEALFNPVSCARLYEKLLLSAVPNRGGRNLLSRGASEK